MQLSPDNRVHVTLQIYRRSRNFLTSFCVRPSFLQLGGIKHPLKLLLGLDAQIHGENRPDMSYKSAEVQILARGPAADQRRCHASRGTHASWQHR